MEHFFEIKPVYSGSSLPSEKIREKGLFRIAWAAPAWGGVAVHINLNLMTDHNKTGAQSTAESSRTFQGNRKKVRVIGCSKQISGNKEMEWGRNI